MSFANFFSNIKEHDSSMLTNIDALLVTNGDVVELTYRSSLTSRQRQRGRAALLKQMENQKTLGVYVWKDSDSEARYQGTRIPHSA